MISAQVCPCLVVIKDHSKKLACITQHNATVIANFESICSPLQAQNYTFAHLFLFSTLFPPHLVAWQPELHGVYYVMLLVHPTSCRYYPRLSSCVHLAFEQERDWVLCDRGFNLNWAFNLIAGVYFPVTVGFQHHKDRSESRSFEESTY